MGKPVSILGDKAECLNDVHGCAGCPHHVIGPATSGSPTVIINSKPVVRIGDTGVHAACCAENKWIAVEGSASVLVNGVPVVRQDDRTRHCGGVGKMIEGSGDVLIGGASVSYLNMPFNVAMFMLPLQQNIFLGPQLRYDPSADLGEQLAAWARFTEAMQPSEFQGGTKCNAFVVAALRAMGIDVPKVGGYDLLLTTIKEHDPVVTDLIDGDRFKDILGPVGHVGTANVGDLILWSGKGSDGEEHHHVGILTEKHGSDWRHWKVTYAGSKHHDIRTRSVEDVTYGYRQSDGTVNTGEGGVMPVTRPVRRS